MFIRWFDTVARIKSHAIVHTKALFILVTLFLVLTQASAQTKSFDRVNTLRQKYLTTHKAWLTNVLDDSEVYRVYVRKILRERGMPHFLEYLPVVESSYQPRAKSKVGALGVWQFMLNSVRPFLTCNDYVDERLDFYKSTDAALTKLQDNYKMFGDWFLAIAAYNCGAGALNSAIKKSGKRDYWALADSGYLKQESSWYVPKLLAIADVVDNAALYGVDFPTANEDIKADDFDYIKVDKSVSLAVLASNIRVDEGELLELNRALLKGVTPPNSEYEIRLPAGSRPSAILALYDMKYFQ